MKLLSRESKTLVGIFVMTLALWLWMNFFVQVRQASWAEQQFAQRQGIASVGAMFVNAPVPVAPPGASATGTVLVSFISEPADATVTINGVTLEPSTPFEAVEVPASVRSVVRLSIGGYGLYEYIEDFTEDRNLSVAIPPLTAEELAALEPQGGTTAAPTSSILSLLSSDRLAVVAPYLLQADTSIIAREVTIEALPFLIGTTASGELIGEDGQPIEGQEDGEGALASRRATINPFVPIVVLSDSEIAAIAAEEERARQERIAEAQRAEQARLAALSQNTAAQTTGTTTSGGNGTTTTQAPAPEAPPPPVIRPQVAQSVPLPRALPRGTLVIAPNIIRSTMTTSATGSTTNQTTANQTVNASDIPADEQRLIDAGDPQIVIETPSPGVDILEVTIGPNGTPVDDFAFEDVTMVRVPGQLPEGNTIRAPGLESGPSNPALPTPLPTVLTPPEPEVVVDVPEVVVETVDPVVEDPNEATNTQTTEDTTEEPDNIVAQPEVPVVAAVNEAARFVRDNNVVFTGSVQGPTSNVGIFRVSFSNTPVVVALGQNFPETNVFLTELTGQEAQLTRGSDTETLILDLRR